MTVTTMKIRLNQAGAELVGPSNGDLLRWNATTQQWEAFTMAPGSMSAFDFILESRADLVNAVGPPIGTEFQMVAGSYAVKTGFALDPNESLNFPAGVPVMMMGMGEGKVLSGAPAGGVGQLLQLQSNAIVQLYGLTVRSTDGSAALANLGARLKTYGCLFQSNSLGGVAVVQNNAGARWDDVGSRLESAADNFAFQGGRCTMSQTFFLGGTGNCLDASTATALEGHFSQCEFDGGTVAAILHQASNGDLYFADCTARANNPGVNVVSLNGCSSFQWMGGHILSSSITPGDGISFDGAMTGGAQIVGPQFDNLDDAVVWAAGVQRRVLIADIDTATDVAVGVDWAAANIPTNGLIESGLQIDSATPYQNHTQVTTNVNRKLCTDQFGPSAETPIVP